MEIKEFIQNSKEILNPISFEEKKELLKKFQDNTLTREEAEKLRLIFEQEKEEAEKTGNIVGAIIIGLLLAVLLYTIYKLSQEE